MSLGPCPNCGQLRDLLSVFCDGCSILPSEDVVDASIRAFAPEESDYEKDKLLTKFMLLPGAVMTSEGKVFEMPPPNRVHIVRPVTYDSELGELP